jgi:very-short-patch-repair endonuclease
VFSHDQALAAGIIRRTIYRRLDAGRWEVILPGVYRVCGVPSTWHQSLMAATLAWGQGAAASHRAAAALRSVPSFEPGVVELIVPRKRQRSISGPIVHRPGNIVAADITHVGPIPVTSVTRTVIDIASIVSRDTLEEALDDALRRRLTTHDKLLARMERMRTSKGLGVLRSLLNERDPRAAAPQSVFETRLLRVLKAAGIGTLKRQHEIRDRGRLVAVVDFAYPDHHLAIEADGYAWHSGKLRWEHDLRRRNALMRLGWRVVHVTWDELHDRPDAVVQAVRTMLEPPEATTSSSRPRGS